MFIMKRLGILFMTLMMVTVFTSCDKDSLGVFNPKVRIAKVYSEADMHYLQEDWIWSTDHLERIDYYKKNGNLNYSQVYHYDQDRLSSIEMDKSHTDFVYDGKMLTNINTYYGDQLLESYALSYEKKKLSHLSIRKNSDKSFANPTHDFLECLFPMDDPVPTTVLFGQKDTKERYDFSAAEIDFIWDGDNVKYMKMTINRPDSVQKLTYSYVYDKMINPKKNFFSLFVDHMMLENDPQSPFCTSNNVMSVYVTDETHLNTHTNSYTYSYDYHQKYPTKIYKTFINTESYMTDSTLLYTYQYQ